MFYMFLLLIFVAVVATAIHKHGNNCGVWAGSATLFTLGALVMWNITPPTRQTPMRELSNTEAVAHAACLREEGRRIEQINGPHSNWMAAAALTVCDRRFNLN